MFAFYKNAVSGGLCEEYTKELQARNRRKSSLVELSLRQQSIPYLATKVHEGWLTREYILREYADYINGRYTFTDCDKVDGYTYGLYVSHNEDLSLSNDVSHFMWCNDLRIEIPETRCPTLYVSNNSDVRIVCDGYNTVIVNLFDESRVTLEDLDKESKAIIRKYSDNCKVYEGNFCFGSVIQRRKALEI